MCYPLATFSVTILIHAMGFGLGSVLLGRWQHSDNATKRSDFVQFRADCNVSPGRSATRRSGPNGHISQIMPDTLLSWTIGPEIIRIGPGFPVDMAFYF